MRDQRLSYLLSEIRNNLEIAKKLLDLPLEEFLRDFRNRYTLRHIIIEIIEASVSVGLHILRNIYKIEKIDGYVSIFKKMIEHGVLSPETGSAMIRLVRLRNLIIHRYWEVDDMRIYRELKDTDILVIEKFLSEVERNVLRT